MMMGDEAIYVSKDLPDVIYSFIGIRLIDRTRFDKNDEFYEVIIGMYVRIARVDQQCER